MRRFEQHPAVRRELRTAARWYETEREGLGGDFLAAVRTGVRAVRRTPLTWPRPAGIDDPSAHHYFLKRFPYWLVYVVDDELLVLLAVAHLSRHPFYWLRRARTPSR